MLFRSLSKSLNLKHELPDINLWLDASDTSTIEIRSGTQIESWANKVNPSIKMHGANDSLDTGATINGLNAINSPGGSDRQLIAYKNDSSAWSPGSADGSISGTYDNLALFLIIQMTHTGRDSTPFNLGFSGRLKNDVGRIEPFGSVKTTTLSTNTTYLMTWDVSAANNHEKFFLNGVQEIGRAHV